MDALGRERLEASCEDLTARLGMPASEHACDEVERAETARLTAAIEAARQGQEQGASKAVGLMQRFRTDWPAETTDMDADMAAAGEFRELSDRLRQDDLPRFEAEFKHQLNKNVIHDIAQFQSWLGQSAALIRDRIDTINESLQAIEYNRGRAITLLAEPTTNQEIRQFRDDLRACTDDALTGDDQYSEERFLQVERILQRFRGRTGHTEADRRWTALVTDVRNWFAFAASERWRDGGEEWEHYTDSDGKSGGQKEKLAYTILAASLAYQFRLEWGVRTSRDFRFVVIDEAFGRGSDASTRYALDLFRKLGLQLLVVTPLQKVHIIEPYVRAVGFVENRQGERSRLQTLTIEEYRRGREAHLASLVASAVGGGRRWLRSWTSPEDLATAGASSLGGRELPAGLRRSVRTVSRAVDLRIHGPVVRDIGSRFWPEVQAWVRRLSRGSHGGAAYTVVTKGRWVAAAFGRNSAARPGRADDSYDQAWRLLGVDGRGGPVRRGARPDARTGAAAAELADWVAPGRTRCGRSALDAPWPRILAAVDCGCGTVAGAGSTCGRSRPREWTRSSSRTTGGRSCGVAGPGARAGAERVSLLAGRGVRRSLRVRLASSAAASSVRSGVRRDAVRGERGRGVAGGGRAAAGVGRSGGRRGEPGDLPRVAGPDRGRGGLGSGVRGRRAGAGALGARRPAGCTTRGTSTPTGSRS